MYDLIIPSVEHVLKFVHACRMSPTFKHSISRSCRYIKRNSKLNQAKKLNLRCSVSLKVTMAPKEDKHAVFRLFCNVVALLLLQISVASAIPHNEDNNYYINAAQTDNSCPESDTLEVCQSAQVKGASDVSNYFSVCPDDSKSFSKHDSTHNTLLSWLYNRI